MEDSSRWKYTPEAATPWEECAWGRLPSGVDTRSETARELGSQVTSREKQAKQASDTGRNKLHWVAPYDTSPDSTPSAHTFYRLSNGKEQRHSCWLSNTKSEFSTVCICTQNCLMFVSKAACKNTVPAYIVRDSRKNECNFNITMLFKMHWGQSSWSQLHCSDLFLFFSVSDGHRWQGRTGSSLVGIAVWCASIREAFYFECFNCLFGQERKHDLFSQKDLKQDAWSKVCCSFLYADQISGVVSNGTTSCFFSMCKCVKPSTVSNTQNGPTPGPCNPAVMATSERIWKERPLLERS